MGKDYNELTGKQLLEKIESGEIGNQVITLLSVYGSNNAKYNVMPTKDKITHEWLGIPNISEDERKKIGFHLKQDSNIELHHGIDFDLKEKNAKAYWDMVKHSELIKFTRTDALNSPQAVFYVEMPSVENKKSVDNEKLTHKAVGYILTDNYENLKHRATVMSIDDPAHYDMETLQSMIIKIAKRDPKRIIEMYGSNVISIQLLFYKALAKNIIVVSKDDSGKDTVYKYGINILGISEEGAIAYLTHADNELLVEEIKEHYDNSSKEKVFTKKENNDEDKILTINGVDYPDNLVQLREMAIAKGCTPSSVNSLRSKAKVVDEIEKL